MTKDQIAAIRFAYLDLMGAIEAQQMGDIHAHDWGTHAETIKDLEAHFAAELDDLIIETV